MHRPTPTGTKRDILRLLARETLGPTAIARELKIGASRVRQHLASLEGYGYVERVSETERPNEPDVYTLGSAARGALPKRYDLMLSALLPLIAAQLRADELSRLLRRAGSRLAQEKEIGADVHLLEGRCDEALRWIEKSLAWQTTVTAESDDHRLVTIHSCLLHEVADLPQEACAEFFAELLGSLCDTHVQPVPAKGISACCKLKLFRKTRLAEGGDEG